MTKLGTENPEIQAQGYDVPDGYGKRVDQHAVGNPERNSYGEREEREKRKVARRPRPPRTHNLRYECGSRKKPGQKSNRFCNVKVLRTKRNLSTMLSEEIPNFFFNGSAVGKNFRLS